MKKVFTAILLIAFSISGVFAIGMSAGAGGSVSSTSWNGAETTSGGTRSTKDAIVPLGATLFFDATYVQLSAGYIMSTKATLAISASGTTATASNANDLSYLTFAALGKYPFKLGPVTLFPLLGVEYDLNVNHPSSGYFEGPNGLLPNPTNSDYNQIWLKGGVGVDVALGGNFYVRTEGLYGFKPLNPDEQAQVTAIQNTGATNVSLTFNTFDLSVLIGYKL